MNVRKFMFFSAVLITAASSSALAQEGTRGIESAVARGFLDGNLIHTVFYNHGSTGWQSGLWPGATGGPHMEEMGFIAAALVPGERVKWQSLQPEWRDKADTVLTPVSIGMRSRGKDGPAASPWGWLPLPGYHNPLRVNPLTGVHQPAPALSSDPSTWPPFWPDRLDESDPGWPGHWNGFAGRGVFQADLESFYVMDDAGDLEYTIDPNTGLPFSQHGVFYPDPSDSTRGGLGLRVAVRTLQWSNPLAEDLLFTLYEVQNVGQHDFSQALPSRSTVRPGLRLAQLALYRIGTETSDDAARAHLNLDLTYGWDSDGIAYTEEGAFTTGYSGQVFLGTPGNAIDGVDNDSDGAIDEGRSSGPGMRIDSQDAIAQYVGDNYDTYSFALHYAGPDATLEDALETRPAYRAGVWWTGDEDLDWVASRASSSATTDQLLSQDDVGTDGLGPRDPSYPGPDEGEADGMPTPGEPNFDRLDFDESDDLGLWGFSLHPAPYVTSGDNLGDDSWLWERLQILPLDAVRDESIADVDPASFMTAGPAPLRPGETTYFSTAWIFGANEQDFLENAELANRIYEVGFDFAQPPLTPVLTARPGDGYVALAWDSTALSSYDRLTSTYDFEGFRLYKSTDPTFRDIRVVTSADGEPILLKPHRQWDLVNGIKGDVPLSYVSAYYDLGDDTGLAFSYVDRDVVNGMRYFYALAAYDRGVREGSSGFKPIDPIESPFFLLLDEHGEVLSRSSNVVDATPRSDAAGFVDAYVIGDVSRPTGSITNSRPLGTGSISIRVIEPDLLPESGLFRITFESDPDPADPEFGFRPFVTTGFKLELDDLEVGKRGMHAGFHAIAGLGIRIHNHEIRLDSTRSGWIGRIGGEEAARLDPAELNDVSTNWRIDLLQETDPLYRPPTSDYELTFVPDSPVLAPRFTGGFIETEVPFQCENVTRDMPCELLVFDVNGNGTWDIADQLVLSERAGPFGPRMFRYRLRFESPPAQSGGPPDSGQRIDVVITKPFASGDYFEFSIAKPVVDPVLARQQLEDVAVVPNPYIVASEWEVAHGAQHRVQFINLPEECVIRIFTVRGELVRTIEHYGEDGDGSAWWDLKTEAGRAIAYGVYVYHVDAPGFGETAGRLAIIR